MIQLFGVMASACWVRAGFLSSPIHCTTEALLQKHWAGVLHKRDAKGLGDTAVQGLTAEEKKTIILTLSTVLVI